MRVRLDMSLAGAGLAALVMACVTAALPVAAQPGTPPVPMLDRLRGEAAAIAPTAQTGAVREWLSSADRLTPIEPRSIWFRAEPRTVLSQAQYDALPEPDRVAFGARPITDENYYATNFGTPLCYARALDLAAQAGGLETFNGVRLLDYGYGQIGQLRMLAACGADAVGVDPAPGLAARYSFPEDQGPYPSEGSSSGPTGSVTLVHGFWPGDEAIAAAVGGGFDIIVARNVLKHGYVHPIGEVPPGAQIDLSVPDDEFLRRAFESLNPGGVWVIYNLGGARLREGAYDPSADINCPWTRAMLEGAGFEVLAFDMDDSEPTREHAVAFGWAKATDPLGSQWFSLYTILRRPR